MLTVLAPVLLRQVFTNSRSSTFTPISQILLVNITLSSSSPQPSNANSTSTVNTVVMYTWAGVEIDLSVICACLPCLPVLFKPFFRSLTGSTKGTMGSNGYGGPSSRYAQLSGKKSISKQRTLSTQDDLEDQHIHMTTTIQQQSHYSESETKLAMPIELRHARKASQKGYAWD